MEKQRMLGKRFFKNVLVLSKILSNTKIMRVRSSLLAFLFIVSSTAVFGQSGTFKGTISVDGEPGAFLGVAIIKNGEAIRSGDSDENGNFIFSNVPQGIYNVLINYLFGSKRYDDVKVDAGKTTEMTVEIADFYYRKDSTGVFFLYKNDAGTKINVKIIE